MKMTKLLALLAVLSLLVAACGSEGGSGNSNNGEESAGSSGGGGSGGGSDQDAGRGGADYGSGEGESGEGGEDENKTVTIDGQQANFHEEADVTGKSSIEYEADDFYFEPTILTGTAGQKLMLEIENEGDAAHTFTLDDGSVDETIEPGQSAEVEVTFPDSGTMPFFCKFHAGSGMRGELKVSG